MPRIEIELTSARDDGTWTWRAAGARQPRGVLDASLLYPGAKVGDVVRAEAEFEIDGITVVTVQPPKPKKAEPERLEIIGPQRETPPVTSSLAPRTEGPRRERRRPERDQEPRERRPPREPGRPARGGPGERPGGEGRPPRPRPAAGRPRAERPPRRSDAPPAADAPPPRPKPKKLQPRRVHRDAVLTGLPPEQQPIAEQVLKGGLAAVRHAVDQENAKATAEGRPEIKADAIVALAEELLPRLRAAEWLDRAEAAVPDVEEIALRDLRSLVASSDAADKDESGRALAQQLRAALDKRVAALRDSWVGEVLRSLDEGRVVRALRISGRPPEPGTRVPPEVAGRLTEAASAALSPETAPARWTTVLEAVASSPVRRSVKPAGLPPEPGDELLEAARKAAGQVPAMAALLGIEVPPPPRPVRPGRPPRPPGRGPGQPGARRPQSARPPAPGRQAAHPPAPAPAGVEAAAVPVPDATTEPAPDEARAAADSGDAPVVAGEAAPVEPAPGGLVEGEEAVGAPAAGDGDGPPATDATDEPATDEPAATEPGPVSPSAPDDPPVVTVEAAPAEPAPAATEPGPVAPS